MCHGWGSCRHWSLVFVILPDQTPRVSCLFWICTLYDKVVLVGKNPPARARDMRHSDSVPGSGRLPGRVHDCSLRYSYLENPTGRGAWRAASLGVTKGWTRLSTEQHTHDKTAVECMVLPWILLVVRAKSGTWGGSGNSPHWLLVGGLGSSGLAAGSKARAVLWGPCP